MHCGRPTEMLFKVEEAVGADGMKNQHEELISMQVCFPCIFGPFARTGARSLEGSIPTLPRSTRFGFSFDGTEKKSQKKFRTFFSNSIIIRKVGQATSSGARRCGNPKLLKTLDVFEFPGFWVCLGPQRISKKCRLSSDCGGNPVARAGVQAACCCVPKPSTCTSPSLGRF